MKKAEMEAHAALYHEKMDRARAAEGRGMYRDALDAAVSAWEHIDGMMQYEKRYQGREFASVPAIDLALRYAPLLLDAKRLDEIDRLLSEYRRIERNASDDLGAKVDQARARIWENHRLWSYLEHRPGALQEELSNVLGGEQERWRAVAESWQRMGLISREPAGRSYRLTLSTRMGEVVPAKCPTCAYVGEGPKGMFLEQIVCPKCRSRVLFVLLRPQSHVEAKG